ncbi:hypothetical protein [Undibacterium oligocarboniphilum]|uniref:Uncharacterized protein n=1 Tax=Undibacterium oligocarboniphilum TaxID=666702 RepID=A0A850QIP6_9BURK|nr:hypothetical protein [Undibacterium oligocarboniphilum]MBC3871842.1 hypothetical protein [Undibacterium oligocarboniphilum]NVO79451.1 hypothetical protein [Undibacterium oligocarboniphilum]
MRVIDNKVIFEDNEKEMWTKLLDRSVDGNIAPHVLRELGEARVRELSDEGNPIWARMAAKMVVEIPQILH